MKKYYSPQISIFTFRHEQIKAGQGDTVNASYEPWEAQQNKVAYIKKNLSKVQVLISYKF